MDKVRLKRSYCVVSYTSLIIASLDLKVMISGFAILSDRAAIELLIWLVTVNKNMACSIAIDEPKAKRLLPETVELHQSKYLN